MSNIKLKIFLVSGLVLAGLVFFGYEKAQAVTNSSGFVNLGTCDKDGTNGDCQYTRTLPSHDQYQAYAGEWKGYYNGTGSGGHIRVTGCLSNGWVFMNPGDACWTLVDWKRGNSDGSMGPYFKNLPNNGSFGSDFDYNYWNVNVWLNDAIVQSDLNVRGRKVSVNITAPSSSSITVNEGQSFSIDWDVREHGGAEQATNPDPKGSSLISCGSSTSTNPSPAVSCTAIRAGTVNLEVEGRGYGGFGVAASEYDNLIVTIKALPPPPPPGPFSLSVTDRYPHQSHCDFELDWTDSANVENYQVFERRGTSGSWTSIATTSKTVSNYRSHSRTWSDMYFYVKASNPYGTSQTSAVYGGICPPPTVDLKARPGTSGSYTNGPITVAYNGTAQLNWVTSNTTSCTASGAWSGPKTASGDTQKLSNLTASGTYTIVCSNQGGPAPADSVVINVSPQPRPSCSSAGPDGASVAYNATSHTVYAYGVSNAASVNFATWSDASGQDDLRWYGGSNQGGGTWSYTINPQNHPGYGNINVHVYMYNPPTHSNVWCDTANYTFAPPPVPSVTLTASPSSISYASSSTLSWSTTNAVSCRASGDWSGNKSLNNSQSTGSLTSSKTYTLTCDGQGGTSGQATTTVNVGQPPVPTVTLTASPSNISYASSSTLSWSTANVTSCSASGGWNGSRPVNGSQPTGSLTSSQTYTLTCTGPGGTRSSSATITVGAPPPPAAPTLTSVNNSTCARLRVNWNDNSSNETGFTVWRSTTSGSGHVNVSGNLPANTTTYLDTPPSTNTAYYYIIKSYINYPPVVEASSGESSAMNLACTANLSNSSKTISAVNGTAYTSSQTIENGDTVTFRIVIANNGNSAATINYIDDTLSDNLDQPFNLRVDKDGDGIYNEGGESGTISGVKPNVRLNVSGSKPAGNPNWVILFDARVNSSGQGTYSAISNRATINYTDPGGTYNIIRSTGSILFLNNRSGVPNFEEVAP